MAATAGGGSSQQQQTWPVPFESAKDCSQGFCSIYCPQWCYIIFPPPPPFALPADEDDSSGPTAFSPLVIAIIGILASAFLLVSYYLIISKYCRRRRSSWPRRETDQDSAAGDAGPHDTTTWHVSSSSNGLDEALIGKISVYKYRRGEGVVDGTDCSVCLGEFREEESLRLLPKCGHAFHLQCIDTWLRSHSNCPLCRANIVSASSESRAGSSNLDANRQRNDEIAVVVAEGADGGAQASSENDGGGDEEYASESRDDRKLRRSFSVDSSQRTRVSVADVLQESDEEIDAGSGSSTSNAQGENSKISVSIKRSLSSGRFGLARQGKGRNSVLPL